MDACVTVRGRSGAHSAARTTENRAVYLLDARFTLTPTEAQLLYWEQVAAIPTRYPHEPQRPRRKLSGAVLVKYLCKKLACTPDELAALATSATRVLLNQAYAECGFSG